MKKIFLIIIVLSMVFSLPSCTVLEKYNDPVYNEEDWIHFNSVQINGIEHLTYQNTTYYNSELQCLWEVGPTPRDVQNFKDADKYTYIGWSGSKFWYHSFFYADSLNNPIFLYSSRTARTYFREDYDYRIDEFLIEEINETIIFQDAFSKVDYTISDSYGPIRLRSKTHPLLWIDMFLQKENDTWYANSSQSRFELSKEFVTILLDNNIIS